MEQPPVVDLPFPVELLLTERGLVSVLVTYLKPCVFVVNTRSDTVYHYNDQVKLWKEVHECTLKEESIKFLQSAINVALPRVRRSEDIINGLHGTLYELEKISFVKKVWGAVKEQLLQPNIMERLNKVLPHCLPILGGQVLDLRDLTTRERTREDLFSFECPVRLTANLTNAAAFFSSIMCDDQEMLATLQKICGYLLTGEKRSRCFFLFWGPKGSNGKSTLIELLCLILGNPYFTVLSSDVTFAGAQKRFGSHTAPLMPLQQARVGVYSESKLGDSLNDGVIKTITSETGGMSARAAYSAKQVELTTCAKLIIETNLAVHFDAKDQAMLDRFVVLPFLARFTDDPAAKGGALKNADFINALRTIHLNEVFTWMAIGAMRWYRDPTFPDTPRMRIFRDELINLQDPVQFFIDSVLKVADDAVADGDHLRTPKYELLMAFHRWCDKKRILCSDKLVKKLFTVIPKCKKARRRHGAPPVEECYVCAFKNLEGQVEANKLAEELGKINLR